MSEGKRKKRRPSRKPLTLNMWYGPLVRGDSPDLCVDWGEGINSTSGGYMLTVMSPVIEELRQRGFDLSTFRLTISKPTQ